MSSKRIVLLLGFAAFIVMADNWVVSPLIPAISESINVTPVSAAVVITAYMVPFGFFQFVFGPLADRLGKSRVIIGTFAAFTVATGLCAVGSTLTGIAVLRALTGAFAAATMPISLALIADIIPMERRQQAIGVFMGVAYLGQALSMGIGGAISYLFDWRGVFIVYAVGAMVVAIALWRWLRVAVTDKETRNPRSPMFKPYVQLLRNFSSLRTYALVLAEGIFILGSFSYLGAVLAVRFNLSFIAIGAVMTTFGVAAMIAGRTSARIAARMGRSGTVAIGFALAAVADGFVWAGGSSLVLTAIGVAVLGFGFMTVQSSLVTIVTEFSVEARGAAMSLLSCTFMVGGGIGTQLGGRIITETSFTTMYLVFGVSMLIFSMVVRPALRVSKLRIATSATLSK